MTAAGGSNRTIFFCLKSRLIARRRKKIWNRVLLEFRARGILTYVKRML